MKSFVVTGALGHIGSALIRALPKNFPGCSIAMIDNMAAERYCSLFDLPPEGRYRFIEGDVRQLDLAPIMQDVDVLVHLAATTNAAGSFDSADAVRRNNFDGTRAVAEACAASGARLIFPSSTSVYGVQEGEVDENCPPELLQPQSPYAESKIEEEQLVQRLCAETGLKAAICRFGTIFGTSPGMRFHTAVNKFCWQAVMGMPLTVWRTAYDQYRPYLDLVDAVSAVTHIVKNELFTGEILNVVSANYTVGDIVEAIRRYCPTLDVNLVDHRIMNQLSYKVVNRRLLDTGFAVSGDVDRGIADTIRLLQKANQPNT